MREDIERLKCHLLKGGGKRFQKDEFLAMDLSKEAVDLLLREGEFYKGKGAKLTRMRTSGCHENALALATDPKVKVCSGLALSSDGIWRSHSWALKGDKIIETTQRRTKYFGVCTRDPEKTEILLQFPPEEREYLEEYLTSKAGKRFMLDPDAEMGE